MMFKAFLLLVTVGLPAAVTLWIWRDTGSSDAFLSSVATSIWLFFMSLMIAKGSEDSNEDG